jgi:hypothetical protein
MNMSTFIHRTQYYADRPLKTTVFFPLRRSRLPRFVKPAGLVPVNVVILCSGAARVFDKAGPRVVLTRLCQEWNVYSN